MLPYFIGFLTVRPLKLALENLFPKMQGEITRNMFTYVNQNQCKNEYFLRGDLPLEYSTMDSNLRNALGESQTTRGQLSLFGSFRKQSVLTGRLPDPGGF